MTRSAQASFDGQAIGNFAAQGRVYFGINRTFQVPKPFMSLTGTVAEMTDNAVLRQAYFGLKKWVGQG